MKKYWTKNKVLFIVIVALIAAIIPFIINWAYKTGGYVTVWDGSDLLAFYGNILTAAAAIIGVYYTLDYSKFKQTEYDKQRVKPCLEITSKQNFYEVSVCGQNDECIYIVLGQPDINIGIGELPSKLVSEITKIGNVNFFRKCYYMDLNIKNVGADNAVSIFFYINEINCIKAFSLPKNNSKIIKVFLDFGNNFFEQNISIRMRYKNTYGNANYEQNLNFMIYRDKKSIGFTTNAGNLILSDPIEI